MNYLAHAALAQPQPQSLVGNLLGDFCKGVAIDTLAQPIQAGLANHRAVDRFTDSHPLVREAIRTLHQAKVPVVTLASDVLSVPRIAYVGIDNRQAGRLAALPQGTALIVLNEADHTYSKYEILGEQVRQSVRAVIDVKSQK